MALLVIRTADGGKALVHSSQIGPKRLEFRRSPFEFAISVFDPDDRPRASSGSWPEVWARMESEAPGV